MIKNRKILNQEQSKNLINARVHAFLIDKVKEKYPDDFWLIEQELDEMVQKYGLKELIMAVGLRLEQIKSSPRGKNRR